MIVAPNTAKIEPFEIRTGTDAEYAALAEFRNAIRRERLPEDPPIPLSEHVAGWRTMPEREVIKMWLARTPEGRVIAEGGVHFERVPENRHLVHFEVMVLPEFRRQGWGRALFAHLVEVPLQEGRTLMMTTTRSHMPGAEVLERVGAVKGLTAHTNQLEIKDLPTGLLESWIQRAGERAQGFELGFWEGLFPEEDLEAICTLIEVMNTAPRSENVEDWRLTPEQLRDWQLQNKATGEENATAYVRDRSTGRLVGYTELFWNPNRPTILQQSGTGVFPEMRGFGLGRWLKAANLLRALERWPSVLKVRTGNADVNRAMLSINHEMGFKPYLASTEWELSLERALAYVKNG